MQVTDSCTSLQAPGFLLLFYTTPYTVVHARSTYIIASLPITCTFSCNFRYYELSLFSRIKQPSCKFLSLLLCTPSCAKGKIQFGRAFSVLTCGHIISHNLPHNIPWPPWRPWNSTVRTDLDIYTGFIRTQLMTNTSGCCNSL